MKKINIIMAAIGMLLCNFSINSSASAQQFNQSWQFKTQNRASIAALIKQVEQEDEASTAVTQAPASYDTLLCGGGDGQSAATGNSTCIILNNSTGAIEIGQDANGSQTANNEASQNMNIDGELGETLSTLLQ